MSIPNAYYDEIAGSESVNPFDPLACDDPTSDFDEYAHYAKLLIQTRIKALEHGPFIHPFPDSTVPWLGAPVESQSYVGVGRGHRPEGLFGSSGMPTDFKPPVSVRPKDPVGIVGAGVGGLYAAMILQSLEIPYTILEASGRTGGRIFTYQFSESEEVFEKPIESPHHTENYFDVGAARFPKIEMMRRLFHLFCCKQLNSHGIHLKSHLAPYINSTKESFLLYNQIRRKRGDVKPPSSDVFSFGVQKGGNVHQDFVNIGFSGLIRDATAGFISALQKDQESKPPDEAGLRMLMRFDQYSVRGYMADCMKLPLSTIDWCETMGRSTGGYDLSLAQTVLNILPFHGRNVSWYRLKGGSQVLTDLMVKYLTRRAPGSLQLHTAVRGIQVQKHEESIVGVTVVCEHTSFPQDSANTTPVCEDISFSFPHVITTVPIGCLRTMDLDDCQLSFDQRNALRMLQSEPSVKIGIKFLSAWWTSWDDLDGHALKIIGGHSFTDRPVRIVVYPSCKSTVLIASYNSSRDATLLGALIKAGNAADKRLKEIVLRDLAAIHNVSYKDLEKEYVAHFAYDWGHNPLSQGAFAFFGPGQFSTLYKNFTHSAAEGRLHFAGEALSARHAWVVGALDASWRAVKEMLWMSYHDKIGLFEQLWGKNREWETDGGGKHGDLLLRYAFACNPKLFE